MADANEKVPVYAPELDQVIQVPTADLKLYRDGGYATGSLAQSAMNEEHSKTATVAVADALNSLGLGLPKRLLTHYSPETAKLLEQYESERPKTALAANIAGFLVPGIGEAKAVQALGLSGKALLAARAAGAAGLTATAEYNDAQAQSELHNTPLSAEKLAYSMGIAGLLGVAGEFAPGVVKSLATKMQTGVAKTIERASSKPYFQKTVIDPITEAFKPQVEPIPGMQYTIDDALKGAESPFKGATPSEPPPISSVEASPPSLPSEPPILGADEFSAPTMTDARRRQLTTQHSDFLDMLSRQSKQGRADLAAEAKDAFHVNDLATERAHPDIRQDIRDERDLIQSEYERRLKPLPPLESEAGAARRTAAEMGDAPLPLVDSPGPLADEEAFAKARLRLPGDFKGRPRPRTPTARQLGKQLLRDAPSPELPSEQALADSAAMKNITDEIPGGGLPSRTVYEYAPGEAPGDLVKHGVKSAVHHALNPVALLGFSTGHGALGAAYAAARAAPDFARAAMRKTEMALLTHDLAVNGIMDYMAEGPTKALGAAARALLQGTATNVASNYLPGNLDDNYNALTAGVTKLAANPEQINNYVQQRWGPVFANKPELLGEVVRVQANKIQHLNEKLPRSTAPVAIYSEPYEPSRTDKLNFLSAYKATNDPMNALVDPTSDVINTIKATNPQLYQNLTTLLHGQLADPKVRKKLSPQSATQISTILGVNVRPYDDPTFIAGLQQTAQAQTQATANSGARAPNQPSGAKPIKLGKQSQSFVSSVAPPSMQSSLADAGVK